MKDEKQIKIEEAKKILLYDKKQYEKKLEIELEDRIDEPRILYLKFRIDTIETVLKELEKKDKIIDLMANDLFVSGCLDFIDIGKSNGIYKEDKEKLKQYFERKADNEN